MRTKKLPGPDSDSQYSGLTFYKKGGMGEIYLANDTINKIKVAIKVIPAEDADELDLLKTEGELTRKFIHENIVRTHHWSTIIEQTMTYLYFVMDYQPSGSLGDLLNRNVPIELHKAIGYMLNISDGLEYAHKYTIHRDLKPENILLSDSEVLKICDFGIAKLVDSKTRTRTFKGAGTLPYMAPECWMFDSNTPLMDMYSLGIIFYEILTLERPFNGRTEHEYKELHLFSPLPELSVKRNDLPIRLIEMIKKMTNKRVQDRYKSMSDVIKVLKEINENQHNPLKSDPLLIKAHEKVSELKRSELEIKKAEDKMQTVEKFITYSKNSLIERFIQRINSLNNQLVFGSGELQPQNR